jgi:hypothetical protein
LERLLLCLQPCKLKAFPQKDSPFLCCTSKHFQNFRINFPKTCTRNLKNFSYTSNFNVETFNNSKNSLPHIFSNFNVENFKNLKLKDLKNTLPHLRTYNTLKKSIPHLPLTWKSCKLLVCHHLEMNSHSLYKLRTLSQKDYLLSSMQYKLKTFHYFLF